MTAGRPSLRIGVAVPEAIIGCPRCGRGAAPPQVTVEVGHGLGLAWLLPSVIWRVRRIAASHGYAVCVVYRGGPAGLPPRPISQSESPRMRFVIMRLTNLDANRSAVREGLGDSAEEEAAMLDWPWIARRRRRLEWGGSRTQVCACARSGLSPPSGDANGPGGPVPD